MHLTNGTMQINFFKDHTKVPTKLNIFDESTILTFQLISLVLVATMPLS